MAFVTAPIKAPVNPCVFEAMQNVDVKALLKCNQADLRPVLPGLVRMALCSPLDASELGGKIRKTTLIILSGLEVVNNIVGLLSIDFQALDQDMKKEQQLRSKTERNHSDSTLILQLAKGLVHEFENCDPGKRIRLILSQLLFVVSELKDGKAGNYSKSSELFEGPVYLEEISDILCIAHAELPELLKLSEVAEALMCFPYGSQLLCQLVANFPDSFMDVCSSLVSRGEVVEEDSLGGRRRLQTLQMLAAMNPRDALSIRALCVENCSMPGLAVGLSLQMSSFHSRLQKTGTDDVISFISSLLLGSDQAVRTWFAQFVKAAQKRHGRYPEQDSMLESLRGYLLQQLRDLIPQPGEMMRETQVVPASALIRLYAALKGIATLKFSEDEMQYLLQLLTSEPPDSNAGTRFVTLAICIIISSANLLRGPEEEQQMIRWTKKLLASSTLFDKEAAGTTSFGELLFLVALHFHSNQISAISDLVCNTLGMKSVVKTSSLARLRVILTQEIFTEQVIAAQAVKMPVTRRLRASNSGYLPIHSVHQLLKSRVFSRHRVPIKDWILRQLSWSCLPLHPVLPQLIECFVSTLQPKTLKCRDLTNQPFLESEILSVFSDFLASGEKSQPAGEKSGSGRERAGGGGGGEENLAPQLLMLYYVMLYQDVFQAASKFNPKSQMLSLRPLTQYSQSMMAQIPINYLVQEAQRRHTQCGTIFPALLRLLVTHYPHLCLVEDWLEDSATLATPLSKGVTGGAPPTVCNTVLSQDSFKTAMSHVVDNPALALCQFTCLLRQPALGVVKFVEPLVDCLPLLLQDGVPRRVLDLAQRVWFRCHALTPRRLRLATVNALQVKNKGLEQFSEQDVVIDPLLVLRCDQRVFRCAPVMGILLRVLSAYIQASRLYLLEQVTSSTNLIALTANVSDTAKVEKEKLELKNALLMAQESAILQILLEICLPLPEEQNQPGELSSLREVRCMVFSFMHQAFIQESNLAKLIHFQGYSSELIPRVVAGVPSMHICLDFIPELLSQPSNEKRIFGIQLLSHLCVRYPLAQTQGVANLAISVLFTMLTAFESSLACQIFLETVPSLCLMCRAFPPLCEDVTALLIQVARLCRSNLALHSNAIVTDPEKLSGPAAKRVKLDSASKADKKSPRHPVENFHQLLTLVQNTFQQISSTSITGKF